MFEANPAGLSGGVDRRVRESRDADAAGARGRGRRIFVSHGGEAFPSLIVVLQGYGVTVDLVGTTFISKAGITSSTFKTVPDVPVGSFELYLPQGKYSALAANGNLCKKQARDADHVHRAERGGAPPVHADRRHRLPQGSTQEKDEGQETAEVKSSRLVMGQGPEA